MRNKLIIVITVQNDSEVIDNGISVRFDHFNNRRNRLVQNFILLCYAVICQQITVPVIDITTGTLYFFCFLNLQFIIIKIFLPFDNLKIEYSLYQDCRCNTKDNN